MGARQAALGEAQLVVLAGAPVAARGEARLVVPAEAPVAALGQAPVQMTGQLQLDLEGAAAVYTQTCLRRDQVVVEEDGSPLRFSRGHPHRQLLCHSFYPPPRLAIANTIMNMTPAINSNAPAAFRMAVTVS